MPTSELIEREQALSDILQSMQDTLTQQGKFCPAIHHAFTEVFHFRQKSPIEQACGATWQTSAKDICHMLPVCQVFPSCSSCCAWARTRPRKCWYLASSASSCMTLRSACIRSSSS